MREVTRCLKTNEKKNDSIVKVSCEDSRLLFKPWDGSVIKEGKFFTGVWWGGVKVQNIGPLLSVTSLPTGIISITNSESFFFSFPPSSSCRFLN